MGVHAIYTVGDGATLIIISAITPPLEVPIMCRGTKKIRTCERDSDAPLPWSGDTESKG